MKRKIFGLILMIAGISIIVWTILVKQDVARKQAEMIASFQDSLIYSQVDENANVNKKVNGALGIMSIPKIEVKAGIENGVTNDVLNYAIGHFMNTPLPGKGGNSCYAGHSNFTHGEFFSSLDKLVIDDEIFIQTKQGVYKYLVSDISVVEPTQIEVLNQTKDPIITLITCTPKHTGTHRLIVKAKQESFTPN